MKYKLYSIYLFFLRRISWLKNGGVKRYKEHKQTHLKYKEHYNTFTDKDIMDFLYEKRTVKYFDGSRQYHNRTKKEGKNEKE